MTLSRYIIGKQALKWRPRLSASSLVRFRYFSLDAQEIQPKIEAIALHYFQNNKQNACHMRPNISTGSLLRYVQSLPAGLSFASFSL